MGDPRHELQEREWLLVAYLLPRPTRMGRPARPARDLLDGMAWILMAGAPCRDLPGRYGPSETVCRRGREWLRDGVLDRILKRLPWRLDEEGCIDWSEPKVEGNWVRASAAAAGACERGGPEEPQDHAPVMSRRGLGSKIPVLADRG